MPSVLSPFQQQLIADHMKLAEDVAVGVWRKAPQTMEKDELISHSYEGLVKAAHRWPVYCAENGYDLNRVEFFYPYATRVCRGKVMDELRKADWAKRSVRDKDKAMKEAGAGTGATDEEVSARTGLSAQEVREVRTSLALRPVSIDAPERESSNPSRPTDLVDGDQVEELAFETVVCQATVIALRQLAMPERVVIALHYYMGKELQEVALMMDITESRASHLHTDAVLAIHAALVKVATAH